MSDLVEWIRAGIAIDEYLASLTPQTQVQRIRGERLGRDAARNRRVLERHRPSSPAETRWLVEPLCQRCWEWDYGHEFDRPVWPCDEVRDVASVYADREGFRPEWGPR